MIIALDYDGTFTADPELWSIFILAAKERGHKAFIVTCREDTPENVEEVIAPGCTTIFTRRAPKDWFMREVRGIAVDVWVDNDMRAVLYGK